MSEIERWIVVTGWRADPTAAAWSSGVDYSGTYCVSVDAAPHRRIDSDCAKCATDCARKN